MDRYELLRRITAFPLTAAALAEDFLAGDFRSVFKGQGIEFDEARRYEAGDDVRSIDWNVSARFGVPYVKLYREEKELTVALVLDTSASMRTGGEEAGEGPDVYEQAVLAAALIAFSAERAGQRMSALFFDREITRIFPPRKGRYHAMAVISAALGENSRDSRPPPGDKGSALGAALIGAARLLKKRSLVVIISDFLCVNWERELGDLARKHDVIALRIVSPLDGDIGDRGLLTMADRETGLSLYGPTSFSSFRSAWTEWHAERARLWEAICRRAGAAHLVLSTSEDAPSRLMRFFGGRRRS